MTGARASAHVHVLLHFIKGEYQRYSTGNVCLVEIAFWLGKTIKSYSVKTMVARAAW